MTAPDQAGIEDGGKLPDYGVVIPAYNSAADICAVIGGLVRAGTKAAQIVVVDDASIDDTARIARGHGVRVVALPTNAGAAAARNRGARSIAGAIVIFVDADVVVQQGGIDRLQRAFVHDPDLAAIFGSYDAHPPGESRISRIRNLLHHWTHQRGAGPASTFWTGFGAIRRDRFEAVGGFDERLQFMEDIDIGMRLRAQGDRILLDPGLHCTHLKQWTLRSMLRTDYHGRAVPWSRLILSRKGSPGTLNTARHGQVSVLGVAASLLCLALTPLTLLALPAAFAFALVPAQQHADFLRLLREVGRPGDVPAAAAILWLFHLTAGLGFLQVAIERAIAAGTRRSL